MSYLRPFIAISIVVLYGTLGYLYLSYDSSSNGDQIAVESFINKDYARSERIALLLDQTIPRSKYSLYLGYIARANQQLNRSDQWLEIAATRENKKSNLFLEITLNKAYNAYLNKDKSALKQAIDLLAKNKGPKTNGWIAFFSGIDAFWKGRYEEAIGCWQASGGRRYFSPWMKHAFESKFSSFWVKMHIVRCYLEEGKYLLARHLLELEAVGAQANQKDEIDFLLGWSYAKEGQSMSFGEGLPYYKLAFSYLDQEMDYEELQDVIASFQKEFLEYIQKGNFENIHDFFTVFDQWEDWLEKEALVHHTRAILEQNENFTQLLAQSNSTFAKTMSTHVREELYQALDKADLHKMYQQWKILEQMDPARMALILDDLESKILKLATTDDSRLDAVRAHVDLWVKLENSPRSRRSFTYRLMALSQQLWNSHRYKDRALNLMRIARQIPMREDDDFSQEYLESIFGNLYRSAMNNDDVTQLPYILDAVEEFQLKTIPIYDESEIASQLEDAHFFYKFGRYDEAKAKAEWVLRVNPACRRAKKILEACAHGTL